MISRMADSLELFRCNSAQNGVQAFNYDGVTELALTV